MFSRPLFAAALWSALAARVALADPPPYLGILTSVRPAEQSLTLKGPDGVERTVRLSEGGGLARERGKDPAFTDLASSIGQVVGYLPSAPDEAYMIVLLRGIEQTEEKGWIHEVDINSGKILLVAEDGMSIYLRPAVNLGAVATAGAAPATAGWKWFQDRLGQPFVVKQVRMNGLPYIWSVTPWATKRRGPHDPGDEAGPEGEAAKPASAP